MNALAAIETRTTQDGTSAWLVIKEHGKEYNIFKFKKLQQGKEVAAAIAVLRAAGATSYHSKTGMKHHDFAALCAMHKTLNDDISNIEKSMS